MIMTKCSNKKIMRPIFPLLLIRVQCWTHFFKLRSAKVPDIHHLEAASVGWNRWAGTRAALNSHSLQGGIYHGKMMESTMIRKDLGKKAHVKWDHLFVKKNRCKPLIPQPFDSALWKLHF